MMATGDTQDPRQAFLDALTGAGSTPPAETPPHEAAPEAPAAPAPLEAAASTPPDTPAPQPESPPAAVPPVAAAAPAPAPAEPAAPLMDLGYDAQVQGTALGLRSVANRLSVVAEGLKLIPTLQNIGQDLESLGYNDVAKAVDSLVVWAQSEEQALMTELEQRTAARQQPQPST